MNIRTALALLLMFFPISLALGDVAPEPDPTTGVIPEYHRPDPCAGREGQKMQDHVVMSKADVSILVHKVKDGNFRANYDCRFSMTIDADYFGCDNPFMKFPVDEIAIGKEKLPSGVSTALNFYQFKVSDGKFDEVDGNSFQFKQEKRKGDRYLQEFLWPVDWFDFIGYKGGDPLDKEVEVQYSIPLRFHKGKANLYYSLTSGAGWKGPIGEETVHVYLEKDLEASIETPKNLKAQKSGKSDFTWELKNIKPTEDIRLSVSKTTP